MGILAISFQTLTLLVAISALTISKEDKTLFTRLTGGLFGCGALNCLIQRRRREVRFMIERRKRIQSLYMLDLVKKLELNIRPKEIKNEMNLRFFEEAIKMIERFQLQVESYIEVTKGEDQEAYKHCNDILEMVHHLLKEELDHVSDYNNVTSQRERFKAFKTNMEKWVRLFNEN